MTQKVDRKYLKRIKLQYFNIENIDVYMDVEYMHGARGADIIIKIKIESILCSNSSSLRYVMESPMITRLVTNMNPDLSYADFINNDPIFQEMVLEAEKLMLDIMKDNVDAIIQICKPQILENIIDDITIDRIHLS